MQGIEEGNRSGGHRDKARTTSLALSFRSPDEEREGGVASGYIERLIRDLAVGDCCATPLRRLKPPGEWTAPEHATTQHPLGDRASLWQQCPGLSSVEDHSFMGESVW